MEPTTLTESGRSILRGKHPQEIRDWRHDWMTRWNETEQFELLVGLLKRGFSIPLRAHVDGVERVLFYLQLATSYYEDNLHEIDEDIDLHPDDRELMRQNRKQLALTAFGELVEHFFATTEKDFLQTGREPGWARYLDDPRIIDALLEFFHVDRAREVRATTTWCELPKHYAQAASTFLINLCKLGWFYHYSGGGRGYDAWELFTDQSPALLLDRQPDLLERLIALGKWTWLLDTSKYPLTAASQDHLERLAFAQDSYPNLNDPRGSWVKRKPSSLQEAVANNNEAAHILVIRQIRKSEADRMAELQAALDEAAAAAQRVKAASS